MTKKKGNKAIKEKLPFSAFGTDFLEIKNLYEQKHQCNLTHMTLLTSSFNFINAGLWDCNFEWFTDSVAILRVLFDLGLEKNYSVKFSVSILVPQLL